MRDTIADLLVFVALALVVAGVAQLNVPAAFITAGVGLAAVAYRIGTKR